MSTNIFKKASNNRFQVLLDEPKEEYRRKEKEPVLKANTNLFKKLKEQPKEVEKVIIDNYFPSLNLIQHHENNNNFNFSEKLQIKTEKKIEREVIKEDVIVVIERDANFLNYLDDICDLYIMQEERMKLMLSEKEYEEMYKYEENYNFDDDGLSDDEETSDDEIEYDEYGEIYE
jgi:hypothetical protein